MPRTRVSIEVQLVEGGGDHRWTRPGRILAAATTHTFAQPATAIDDAFACGERAHLCQFDLADGAGSPCPIPTCTSPARRPTTAGSGCRAWFPASSSCTCSTWATTKPICAPSAPNASTRNGPSASLPPLPLPYRGWGSIPDQYGRRFDGDDGESRIPKDPHPADLPPLRPGWGPEALRGPGP